MLRNWFLNIFADSLEPFKYSGINELFFSFSFETEKGINRQETGQLKTVVDAENKPQTVVVVRGSYSYTDNDGKVETINYEADEEGYRAQGASIPVAPVARR